MRTVGAVIAALAVAGALVVVLLPATLVRGLTAEYGPGVVGPVGMVVIGVLPGLVASGLLLVARDALHLRRPRWRVLAVAAVLVAAAADGGGAVLGAAEHGRAERARATACSEEDVRLLEGLEVPSTTSAEVLTTDSGACELLVHPPGADPVAVAVDALEAGSWREVEQQDGVRVFQRDGAVLDLTSQDVKVVQVRLSLR